MNESNIVRSQLTLSNSRVATGAFGGLVGGALAGIGAGVVARLSMRGVAMLAGMGVSFSIGGTAFILIFGAILGAIAGLLYGLLQAILPGPIRLKAFFYGLLWSALVVVASFLVERQGELTLISREELALLFGPIPLVYGLALGSVHGRLEGRFTM